MNHVWQFSRQKGSALLVLLAIADNANDQGVAWPSEKTIAGKARMSERQIRRIVHAIAEDGELAIEARRGRDGVVRNIYTVEATGQVDRRPTGQNPPNPPDIAMAGESSVEPSLALSKESAHASIYQALVAECFPAGATLTKRAKQQTAIAATNIVSGGGTALMVPAVKRAYLGHSSYGKCALTPMALSNRWSELAPVAMLVPCLECGIAGGRHAAGCERIAA